MQIQTLEDENAELRAQLEAMRTDLSAARAELEKLSREGDGLKRKVEGLESANAELSNQVACLPLLRALARRAPVLGVVVRRRFRCVSSAALSEEGMGRAVGVFAGESEGSRGGGHLPSRPRLHSRVPCATARANV